LLRRRRLLSNDGARRSERRALLGSEFTHLGEANREREKEREKNTLLAISSRWQTTVLADFVGRVRRVRDSKLLTRATRSKAKDSMKCDFACVSSVNRGR